MIALMIDGSMTTALLGIAGLMIGSAEVPPGRLAVLFGGVLLLVLATAGFILAGVAMGMRP